MTDDSNTLSFRDYQLAAIANVFADFGVQPAGPPDDPVVTACRSHRARKDGDDGGAGQSLAKGASDDVVPPF